MTLIGSEQKNAPPWRFTSS